MAIYHLSVKTIGRATGRSATAAAAYRAAAKIVDERTGEVHNFRRKRGVVSADLVLPAKAPEWAKERSKLWSAAEVSETRKNSTVAREFEVALPAELSADERKQLAHDFARELVERHGFAADVAIHLPGKEGDNRNHHAHILCTTRQLTPDGFGKKTRELDQRGGGGEVEYWRQRFAELQNESLARAGVAARVDHRSLKKQGLDREPTQHLGPNAMGYERRTGDFSDVTQRRIDQDERRRARAQLEQLERQARELAVEIDMLTIQIGEAAAERDELELQEQRIEQQRQKVDQARRAILGALAQAQAKPPEPPVLADDQDDDQVDDEEPGPAPGM